jgi:hypothetical protein
MRIDSISALLLMRCRAAWTGQAGQADRDERATGLGRADVATATEFLGALPHREQPYARSCFLRLAPAVVLDPNP